MKPIVVNGHRHATQTHTGNRAALPGTLLVERRK